MTAAARDDPVYGLYGLRLRSALPLPELAAEAAGDAAALPGSDDVDIRLGAVPEALPDPLGVGPTFQAGRDGRFLIALPGVGRYLVDAGRRITVEAAPGADERDLRLFLLGSAVGALLYQRGRFPLHGSVVLASPRSDQAVAFLGDSGMGKSTLAATLALAGHPVISDDLCVADPTGAGSLPRVAPGFPHLRLWEDALRRLDRDTAGLVRDRRRLDKYRLPLTGRFHDGPAALRVVYVLEETPAGESPSVVPANTLEALALLNRHTYRPRFVRAMGCQAGMFRHTAAVAATTSIYRLLRPRDAQRIPELLSVLQRHWTEIGMLP